MRINVKRIVTALFAVAMLAATLTVSVFAAERVVPKPENSVIGTYYLDVGGGVASATLTTKANPKYTGTIPFYETKIVGGVYEERADGEHLIKKLEASDYGFTTISVSRNYTAYGSYPVFAKATFSYGIIELATLKKYAV